MKINYLLLVIVLASMVGIDENVKRLDNLFQHAVEKMTQAKLEKSDFHILSRLIQQELTMLKFNS